MSPLQEKERFLEANGWKRGGANGKGETLWADPRGSNDPGKMEHTVAVPNPKQKGQTISYQQLVVPPCPWDYPTGQAVQIQHERDANKVKQVA